MKNTKSRIRRTNQEVETELWNAVENQILEKGFNGVNITGIAQAAKVELSVIYNRFTNLDDLLEKYAQQHDYWRNDIFSLDNNLSPKENFKAMMVSFIDELYNNEVIQKMLIWELNDTCKTTRHFSLNRELHSKKLLDYFNEQFKHSLTKTSLDGALAVLIGGIYYIILHRRISTFAFIDFDTEEGKEKLKKTVENLIDYSFVLKPEVEIAHRLKGQKIDIAVIAQCTGLTIEQVEEL